jgi:hypothetical protein
MCCSAANSQPINLSGSPALPEGTFSDDAGSGAHFHRLQNN